MKKFVNSRWFAVCCILYGLFGLAILGHHIGSYENILRPYMSYLIENKVITNDINGITFLYMFTNQSNIFVDVFLILFATGTFGSRKLSSITRNDKLRAGITLYILITGIIYCAVLLPFQQATFPWEKGIWFSNVFNVWQHMITPALFTAFWFVAIDGRKIPVAKTAVLYLAYPLIYFVFSVIRGKITGFYPYPFLSSHQMWELLFKGKEYAAAPAIGLLVAVVIVLLGLFYGLGCALNAIHNKIVSKYAD